MITCSFGCHEARNQFSEFRPISAVTWLIHFDSTIVDSYIELMVLMYVDDIIIMSSRTEGLHHVFLWEV